MYIDSLFTQILPESSPCVYGFSGHGSLKNTSSLYIHNTIYFQAFSPSPGVSVLAQAPLEFYARHYRFV